MGSIVSHLADIIKLYGSYENYLAEMEENELRVQKEKQSQKPNPDQRIATTKEPSIN